jgi:hypothetical protein
MTQNEFGDGENFSPIEILLEMKGLGCGNFSYAIKSHLSKVYEMTYWFNPNKYISFKCVHSVYSFMENLLLE